MTYFWYNLFTDYAILAISYAIVVSYGPEHDTCQFSVASFMHFEGLYERRCDDRSCSLGICGNAVFINTIL